MAQQWMNVESVMKIACSLERSDFLMAHPNSVLISAEIRQGILLPASGKKKNMTMHYRTGGVENNEGNNYTPVRFVPIRRPAISTRSESKARWLTVGRTSDNPIMINDYTVSKQHARIQEDRKNGTFVVEELGSTNGSWINDERLVKGESNTLKSGDTIRFGRHIFTFLNGRMFYDFLLNLSLMTQKS